MAQLRCIGLWWLLTKPPCGSCAIYFTTVYVWSLKNPWSPFPMKIPRRREKRRDCLLDPRWSQGMNKHWKTAPLTILRKKRGFFISAWLLWSFDCIGRCFSSRFWDAHMTVEKPSSVPFMLYQRWIFFIYGFTYLYRFPWNKQNSSPLWRGEVVVANDGAFLAQLTQATSQMIWFPSVIVGFKQKAMAWLDDFVWFLAFWKIPCSQKTLTILHIHITYLLYKKMCFLFKFQPHLLRTPNTEFCQHECGAKIGPVSLACCFLNEWIAWLLASIFFWIRRYSWDMRPCTKRTALYDHRVSNFTIFTRYDMPK